MDMPDRPAPAGLHDPSTDAVALVRQAEASRITAIEAALSLLLTRLREDKSPEAPWTVELHGCIYTIHESPLSAGAAPADAADRAAASGTADDDPPRYTDL
jgi:hypothetical protein